MSRITIRVVVVVLVVAGAVWGIRFLTRPTPVAVVVHAVARGTVESTVANTRAGTVKAARRAGLAPAIPGLVVELPVREGDVVEGEQLMLRLWADDLEAELQLRRAETEQARALHEEACERAAHDEREADRIIALHADGIAAEEEVDHATSQAVAQKAACRAAEVAVQVGEARVVAVEAKLAQTVLRAPFAGIVAEVNAELGEFVTPSPVGIPTPPAIDMLDRTSLYVAAPLDEVDAPAVRVGMSARVTLDALRGEVFDTRVRRIAPYVLDVEKQARTVEIEVDFKDPAALAKLLPGYSADVEVVLDARQDVLRVPTEAVIDGAEVLVLDEAAGELRAVAVETGVASWTWTEVTAGLEAGALVVVSLDRDGVAAGAAAVVESRDRR